MSTILNLNISPISYTMHFAVVGPIQIEYIPTSLDKNILYNLNLRSQHSIILRYSLIFNNYQLIDNVLNNIKVSK